MKVPECVCVCVFMHYIYVCGVPVSLYVYSLLSRWEMGSLPALSLGCFHRPALPFVPRQAPPTWGRSRTAAGEGSAGGSDR